MGSPLGGPKNFWSDKLSPNTACIVQVESCHWRNLGNLLQILNGTPSLLFLVEHLGINSCHKHYIHIHLQAMYYNSLTWMIRPFWVGFPYNHYLLGWPIGGKGRNNLQVKKCSSFFPLGFATNSKMRGQGLASRETSAPWIFSHRCPWKTLTIIPEVFLSYPKDHWTLQWKGLNLYNAGVGPSK